MDGAFNIGLCRREVPLSGPAFLKNCLVAFSLAGTVPLRRTQTSIFIASFAVHVVSVMPSLPKLQHLFVQFNLCLLHFILDVSLHLFAYNVNKTLVTNRKNKLLISTLFCMFLCCDRVHRIGRKPPFP